MKWLTTGFTLLISLAMGAKYYALKDENVKKCIRMGITVLKMSFGEGKSSVLWLQIAFYGDALARRRKMKFPTIKPMIYLFK